MHIVLFLIGCLLIGLVLFAIGSFATRVISGLKRKEAASEGDENGSGDNPP